MAHAAGLREPGRRSGRLVGAERRELRGGARGDPVGQEVGVQEHRCREGPPGRGGRETSARIGGTGRHEGRQRDGGPVAGLRRQSQGVDARRPGIRPAGAQLRGRQACNRDGEGAEPGRAPGHIRGHEQAADADPGRAAHLQEFGIRRLLGEQVERRAPAGEGARGQGGAGSDPAWGVQGYADGGGAVGVGDGGGGVGGGGAGNVGGVSEGEGGVCIWGDVKEGKGGGGFVEYVGILI